MARPIEIYTRELDSINDVIKLCNDNSQFVANELNKLIVKNKRLKRDIFNLNVSVIVLGIGCYWLLKKVDELEQKVSGLHDIAAMEAEKTEEK